jgi:Haem degrading protein HbpS-like
MTDAMYTKNSKHLTTEGAKKMMATAIDKAKEAGIAITVAITDAGGHLILLERMDGGRFHTVHSATTKAVCSASNQRPTASHGAQAQVAGFGLRPLPVYQPPGTRSGFGNPGGAVMLQLVRPAGTTGRLFGDDWLTRMNEKQAR